jgi:hypothetical protein
MTSQAAAVVLVCMRPTALQQQSLRCHGGEACTPFWVRCLLAGEGKQSGEVMATTGPWIVVLVSVPTVFGGFVLHHCAVGGLCGGAHNFVDACMHLYDSICGAFHVVSWLLVTVEVYVLKS